MAIAEWVFVSCDGVALAFGMLVNGQRGDYLQALRRTTVDRARLVPASELSRANQWRAGMLYCRVI
jgi:hypothetical protein